MHTRRDADLYLLRFTNIANTELVRTRGAMRPTRNPEPKHPTSSRQQQAKSHSCHKEMGKMLDPSLINRDFEKLVTLRLM